MGEAAVVFRARTTELLMVGDGEVGPAVAVEVPDRHGDGK